MARRMKSMRIEATGKWDFSDSRQKGIRRLTGSRAVQQRQEFGEPFEQSPAAIAIPDWNHVPTAAWRAYLAASPHLNFAVPLTADRPRVPASLRKRRRVAALQKRGRQEHRPEAIRGQETNGRFSCP